MTAPAREFKVILPMLDTPATTIQMHLDTMDPADSEVIIGVLSDCAAALDDLDRQDHYWLSRRQEYSPMTASEAHSYFRSQERSANTRLLLQYLQSFWDHLPDSRENEQDMANPWRQVLDFVLFAVNLLEADDVITAALRFNRELGLVTDGTTWYYRGKIRHAHQSLQQRLLLCKTPDAEGWAALLNVIQSLCLFWFRIRNENMKKVRRSDLCLYQLSRMIRARHNLAPFTEAR